VFLLLERNTTVTVCHIAHARPAGRVCARRRARGRGGVSAPDRRDSGAARRRRHDVGINRLEDGLAGDVAFEAAATRRPDHARPRRRGAMTIACLLRNTLQAARARAAHPAV